MVRGNRNNRRRNGRVSRRPRRGNGRKSAFNGRMVQAPVFPRATCQAPWNTCVIQRTATVANSTVFTVTPSYVRDALIAQLGLPTTIGGIGFRFISAEVYDLAGRPIEMKLQDVFSTSPSALVTGIDYPGRSGWAKLRLIWPKSVSANSYSVTSTTDAKTLIAGSVSTPLGNTTVTSTNILLKIKVLWRVANETSPTLTHVNTGTLAVEGHSTTPFEPTDVCVETDDLNDIEGTFEHMEVKAR
jgi:hypothetical protein